MRVLILSCNTGEGHNSCGRAIQEAFRGQGIDCEMVDALSFISPSVSQLISSSFNRIYRYTPGLFSRGYRYAEAHPGMFRDGTLVDRAITAGVERTYRYIQDGAYDVAVCTHVFTAMIATEVLRRHAPSLQTYFVATDYTCSPSCGESELDAYFIPDECLSDEFAGQGIPRRKLVASGIPIRQAFYASVEREAAKASLSLPPDCRHLLIMSGSMGCGPIPALVRLIAGGMSEDCRVSVVCGSNQRLYRAMEQEYADDPRVQILGYRKDVPLLMDSADLYMTKPGGISTTEAASKRLPMVLVNAVAGCEDLQHALLHPSGGRRHGGHSGGAGRPGPCPPDGPGGAGAHVGLLPVPRPRPGSEGHSGPHTGPLSGAQRPATCSRSGVCRPTGIVIRKGIRKEKSPRASAPGLSLFRLTQEYAQATTTGATLPVSWMLTMSLRGHFSTQMPQEVHLS